VNAVFAGEVDRGPGDTDCISLAGTENEAEASKVSPRIRVDWIVELQQLLDRTINTGQQRDLRAVPDSGLNSPGLEEETVTITGAETQSRFSSSADMATGIVRARGVLDRETLNSLRGTIDLLVSEGRRTVTVDLAEVSCIDQAAVVLFAALQHGLYTHHGELRLTNASTGVRDTLINGQVAYTDAAS
jgi:anti-anti-sigma regulatory factor